MSKYNPIFSTIQEWPLVKLHKQKKQFLQEVITLAYNNILDLGKTQESLHNHLEKTLYREKIRLQKKPWKVDSKNEVIFWQKIQNKFTDRNSYTTNQAILTEIITHYTQEIAGNFKPSHYRLAGAMVRYGFSRLLNVSKFGSIRHIFSNRYKLKDKIHIIGAKEQLRKLAKIGTIVMVPTHFSHLDSALIGWVIQTLGLPPFIYGAGLNLFNINIFAYFMNSLGVYKIDRRKKNLLYLETLKAYSSIVLQKQCHSLFYPGGTRSRSGMLEKELKLGLLGTAMEAQRINYQRFGNNAPKIFIVPVVFNYHFVLEAPTLIKQHLSTTSKGKLYHEQDEYSKSYKIIKFLLAFFTKGSDISISIGHAMDLLGNTVDNLGHSYTKDGQYINTCEYFMMNNQIIASKQREEEYTRILSRAIVKAYYRINCVFASHLVAFVAFELIKKKHHTLDLYSLLRLSTLDCVISYTIFKEYCEKIRRQLIALYQTKHIQLADNLLHDAVESIVKYGLNNIGLYHAQKPLIKNKEGNITTQNSSTLYYYHNRLKGYDLEQYIH